jgi:3-dehydroquinate dehydratase-2
MKKVLLLNGPNLNLLGTREPNQYGHTTLADVEAMFTQAAQRLGFEAECFQSNWEGALIDKIHEYGRLFKAGEAVGAVFNPGAFTHTSIALHDAIKGVDGLPVYEIHISNVHAREAFRHHSYFSDIAVGTITGLGAIGYELALRAASQHLATGKPGNPPLPN